MDITSICLLLLTVLAPSAAMQPMFENDGFEMKMNEILDSGDVTKCFQYLSEAYAARDLGAFSLFASLPLSLDANLVGLLRTIKSKADYDFLNVLALSDNPSISEFISGKFIHLDQIQDLITAFENNDLKRFFDFANITELDAEDEHVRNLIQRLIQADAKKFLLALASSDPNQKNAQFQKTINELMGSKASHNQPIAASMKPFGLVALPAAPRSFLLVPNRPAPTQPYLVWPLLVFNDNVGFMTAAGNMFVDSHAPYICEGSHGSYARGMGGMARFISMPENNYGLYSKFFQPGADFSSWAMWAEASASTTRGMLMELNHSNMTAKFQRIVDNSILGSMFVLRACVGIKNVATIHPESLRLLNGEIKTAEIELNSGDIVVFVNKSMVRAAGGRNGVEFLLELFGPARFNPSPERMLFNLDRIRESVSQDEPMFFVHIR